VVSPHPNQRDPSTLPVELRRAPIPAASRAWVERQTGLPIVGVRRLPGASSAAVHALRFADGSPLVLRRYAWPGFLVDEPGAAHREVDALGYVHARGIAAPEVVAHDLDGTAQETGVPAILMTFVPGSARAVPDLDALARAAAAIHAVDSATFPHEYFPWCRDTMTDPPAAARQRELWVRALVTWRDAMPEYTPALVHRDFHPGNVHWSRGAITGIVDWANACRGPVGCDLAHCASNLRVLAGDDTADAFLRAYASHTGVTLHPYWALASILEHDPDHFTPAQVAVDEPRLARVLAELG
jgi:aminoglycoside phosphotransferase (APT) family kinase protein